MEVSFQILIAYCTKHNLTILASDSTFPQLIRDHRDKCGMENIEFDDVVTSPQKLASGTPFRLKFYTEKKEGDGL